MRIWLLALATILLLVAGCRGSSAQPTPVPESQLQGVPPLLTTNPTATFIADLDLEKLILIQQDMPEGFTLGEQVRIDNRAAAREWSDPQEWLDNYANWGRIEGFDAEFESVGLKELIKLSISVYRTADGARESFKRANDELNSEIKKTTDVEGIELIVLEELEIPRLGDESFALHLRISLQVLGTPTILDSITIGFRKGTLKGSASWASFEARILLSDVVALAQKQLERLP